MAAARMTMAVSSSCVAAATVRNETAVARNGARVSMVGAMRAAMDVASLVALSSAGVGGRVSVRNLAVVARASELEEVAVGESDFEKTLMDQFPKEDSFGTPGQQMSAPAVGSKLYVGNLPWTCDSQQLAEVFQDVGTVELVEVIYDRETNRSRGFAFVTMSTLEGAQHAIEKLDGSDLGGRAMKVNFPQSNREPRTPREFNTERPRREGFGSSRPSYDNPNKLFVGNLSWGVDDVSLSSLFSDFGKVIDAKVVYDRDSGRSRGFGFVTFSDASEVNEAIQSLDGAEFDGRQLRVNLAGEKPPPRQY